MIDYPSGKIELALIWFIDYIKDILLDLKDMFCCGKEYYKELTKKKAGKLIPVVLILIVILIALYIYDFANHENKVTVTYDVGGVENTINYLTSTKRVGKFIEERGIDYNPDMDTINVESNAPITEGLKIKIVKAFECSITCDGETIDYIAFPPFTVKDVLEDNGIVLDELDLINFELTDEVKAGDEIVIQRVTMKYVVEQEEEPFKVEYVRDSSLTIGKTEVSKKGRKGVIENSYLVVYIDGEETSRTLTSSEVLQKKRNKVIKYGTHILSGVPKDLKYIKKLSHCRVVSYHFGGNPHGVYGMPCKYGTCAVDRDVIPLGSKLYIEGYGYAIANDVGSAINGKTIDVYMERMSQCGVWGARWGDVYIISYGNDKSYWE